MSFFSNLINNIRGINKNTQQVQLFTFGSIISGTYQRWKTDSHPTILCLGNYNNNGQWYVHGIQMHLLGGQLNYLLNVIKNIKNSGMITNPRMFFNYLKMNNPSILKFCYRTYISALSDFKTISPGFSNINEDYCYPITDERDGFVNSLKNNNKINFIREKLDMTSQQLRENITNAINTIKIW